jgi:hypothetical protein
VGVNGEGCGWVLLERERVGWLVSNEARGGWEGERTSALHSRLYSSPHVRPNPKHHPQLLIHVKLPMSIRKPPIRISE